MAETNERIDQLFDKLESLLKKQESFSKEVNEVREELNRLKTLEIKQVTAKVEAGEILPVTDSTSEILKEKVAPAPQTNQQQPAKEPIKYSAPKVNESSQIKEDLEKFIGENLINKIGIVITVIGVAIGAKYAIDHQLISPLARILIGYLTQVASYSLL